MRDPLYSHARPLVAPNEVARWLGGIATPVAITGGTGFLGSHLVDTLAAAGIATRVLVRDPARPRWIGDGPAELVPGALDDAAALARLVAGAGTVIHLAGVLRAARAADFERGNRDGTATLVAALGETPAAARLVHVSSLAAVGPAPTPAGIAPDAEPRPISAYGRSKLGAEQEVQRWAGPWTVLRPPAIYGPRDRDVLEFFKMAARGVAAVPAGERWLTLAWVGDVVRAIAAAAAGAAATGAMLHLGHPEPVRLEQALHTIAAAGKVSMRVVPVPAVAVRLAGAVGAIAHGLGLHSVPITPDKAGELLARHWTADTRSSLAALEVGDGIDLVEGARRTWEWYRAAGWLR